MLGVFREKFLQAWSACMLCMVQGDLSVLSASHALTASKTGALAGAVYCVTALGGNQPRGSWYPVWLTGVVTMVADIAAHPTHFGSHWTEAFCTGAGAAGICFIWEKVKK